MWVVLPIRVLVKVDADWFSDRWRKSLRSALSARTTLLRRSATLSVSLALVYRLPTALSPHSSSLGPLVLARYVILESLNSCGYVYYVSYRRRCARLSLGSCLMMRIAGCKLIHLG